MFIETSKRPESRTEQAGHSVRKEKTEKKIEGSEVSQRWLIGGPTQPGPVVPLPRGTTLFVL